MLGIVKDYQKMHSDCTSTVLLARSPGQRTLKSFNSNANRSSIINRLLVTGCHLHGSTM